ncbi:MAG: N-acetyl-gamma-glutamyl-phosphate reductase [Spirochaetia bacterium]|nr:N-acetyl-gamma-glutamyl-phosphate reductase [Spirochaetia bacterium]
MKSSNTVKAGIIGAGGFTGQELIKIFSRHLGVHLGWITSDAYKGISLNEAFPELAHPDYEKLKFSAHPQSKDDIPDLDVIFLAVPDEASMFWIEKLHSSKYKIIDISGAFRLSNPELYVKYYGFQHTSPELLPKVVYGLTEINREAIKNAQIVANPGCYATSAILPILLMGKVYKDLFKDSDGRIIVDAKSGTSGAGGRKEKDSFPYSKTNENFRSYKIKTHQHIPEIAEQIAPIFSTPVLLNMTPHLLPLFRGLQTNTYVYFKNLNKALNTDDLILQMKSISEKETFIRFYENPEKIELRNVQGTNYLDFSFYYDQSSCMLQIIAAIDNLQKGAAGQAVQNLNLMFGLQEHHGLL